MARWHEVVAMVGVGMLAWTLPAVGAAGGLGRHSVTAVSGGGTRAAGWTEPRASRVAGASGPARVAEAAPSKAVKGARGEMLFNGKLRLRIDGVREESEAEAADLHPGADQKVLRIEGVVRNGLHESVTVRPDYTLVGSDGHVHKVAVLELCVVTLAQGAVGKQLVRTVVPRSFAPVRLEAHPGQLMGGGFAVDLVAAPKRASSGGGSPAGRKAHDDGGANQVDAVAGSLGKLLGNGKVKLRIDVVREETTAEAADLSPRPDQKVLRIEGSLTNLTGEDIVIRPDMMLADREGVTQAVGVLDLCLVRLARGASGAQRVRTLVPQGFAPARLIVTPGQLYGKPFRIQL